MRDGWSECSLGDIAEVLDRMRKPISGAEREKRIGDVPYYGATGQAGWIDKPIFDEELVLLGEDAIDFLNPDVHKAYLISGPSWVNNHAHVLRAKREKVLSFFLMEALNAVDYSQFVAFGTRSKLTQGSMMGISVRVPPLVEQKRIVDVVSSVDAYIDALQQQADTTRTARNAVLHELLSAGGDGWTETTLGDISNFVSRRELPKGLALDTPYVGLEHVEPKTTLISSWGDVESISSSVTPFEPEDTLFGRLRPYLHKVAFADFPGVCSPEILVLRSNAKCESKFLYLLCSLNSTIKNCVDMSAGTRMPRISTADLASISVRLPPLNEQKRIVEIVSSMEAVILSTEQAVTAAKDLRSGLLSDLLSGEHEIPATYDSLLGAA